MTSQVELYHLGSAQSLKIYPPGSNRFEQGIIYASDLGDLNSDGYDDYGLAFWSESGEKVYVLSGWQFQTSAAMDWQLFQ